MATSARTLIHQHSINPVRETFLTSSSSKAWAKKFPPISKFNVHTSVEGNDKVVANFDGPFLPELEDDVLRMANVVYPPNYRQWRLNTEEDGINWFHSELSNVVLGAFATHPGLLQASHEKPLSEENHTETVDVGYSVSRAGQRRHVAIGEFKRCLLAADQWQNGRLLQAQKSFSQELRGYAFKYACPQIFCFDNSYLLMIQFRAQKVSEIQDANCEVDCWILPRENTHGTPLRYALYRLLVQGLRRCQGGTANPSLSLNGVIFHRRYFFNGVAVWKINGSKHLHPWGYNRRLHKESGAFYWVNEHGEPLIDGGAYVWDTLGYW